MNNLTSQLDPKIQQLLQTLRARIKMYVWVEGISLGVIWVTAMFWIGLAMDYLPILLGANELSSVARAILLVIVAAAFGYILYRWVFQRAFVALSDRSMAILLERQFSSFNDSLVTSVTLKKNSTGADTSTDGD
ncbi:MAG: polyketide synthase, partial [Pirellulaceae bacterium]|nr:polyketide synthase [Pirellulaceae bacterium]